MNLYWPVDLRFVELGPPFMGHADKGNYRPNYGYHTGQDFLLRGQYRDEVNQGGLVVPIHCIFDGIVEYAEARTTPGYGSTIVMYHPFLGVRSRYAHLGSITVNPGAQVPGGAQIGTLGNTGTDNYHLHFDILHRRHEIPRFNPYNPTVGGVDPRNPHRNQTEAILVLSHFQDPIRFMAHRPAIVPGANTAHRFPPANGPLA